MIIDQGNCTGVETNSANKDAIHVALVHSIHTISDAGEWNMSNPTLPPVTALWGPRAEATNPYGLGKHSKSRAGPEYFLLGLFAWKR